MITDLWDRHGQAVASIDEDHESIFMRDGTPVAWLSREGVYTYRGKVLGWFWEGWIFGQDGKCVLFTERAQPKPAKPFRQPPEDRGDQRLRPMREGREVPRKRPERALMWSSVSAQSFFRQ